MSAKEMVDMAEELMTSPWTLMYIDFLSLRRAYCISVKRGLREGCRYAHEELLKWSNFRPTYVFKERRTSRPSPESCTMRQPWSMEHQPAIIHGAGAGQANGMQKMFIELMSPNGTYIQVLGVSPTD